MGVDRRRGGGEWEGGVGGGCEVEWWVWVGEEEEESGRVVVGGCEVERWVWLRRRGGGEWEGGVGGKGRRLGGGWLGGGL